MTTRAPFLTRSYGGYYHRDLPPEDDVLTHVGPGTPCGEYLRRFWNPVVFSDELNDLPVRVRVMGEDLVVFKDRQGQVGALQLHCCHRGTSLEFGVVSERGLRCCYHGWLFDVDGRVLETPGEPASSTLKDRLYQGAYPTEVYHGIVFVYMGPPETKPPFPVFDTYVMPGYRARVACDTRCLLTGSKSKRTAWTLLTSTSCTPSTAAKVSPETCATAPTGSTWRHP